MHDLKKIFFDTLQTLEAMYNFILKIPYTVTTIDSKETEKLKNIAFTQKDLPRTLLNLSYLCVHFSVNNSPQSVTTWN